MPENQATARYLLIAVMLAVLGWGVFQAIGSVNYNGNPWRGVVVLGCFLGFLGIWLLLLAQRSRRSGGPPKS